MFTAEFLVTSLVVVLIPGTGVVFTVSTGLAHGRRASFFASVGCTLGIVPHLLATVLGLAAVMFVAYGLLAHEFRKAVIESPRVQAWLRRGFAGAFAGLGAQLAVSDR